MEAYLPFLFLGLNSPSTPLRNIASPLRDHIIVFLSNKLHEPASDGGQQYLFIFFRMDADRHSQQQRLDLLFAGAWEDSGGQ